MKKFQFKRSFGWKILYFLSTFIIILTVAGFFGRSWWWFDVACHFRVQYFWILIFSAIVCTLGRKWIPCILITTFALINAATLIPYITTAKPINVDSPKIRAVSINLDYRNSSYEKAVSFISQSQPQLLILGDLSERWEDGLRETLAEFPYFIRLKYAEAYFIEENFMEPFREILKKHKISLGLFSKLPFESRKLGQVETYPTPYVMAQFKFNEKPFTLLGAHLMIPASNVLSKTRNKQITFLTQKIQSIKQPTVLLGDLNITPWSPFFKDFIQKTGLNEARKEFGISPTWPTGFASLQIPIDHSLTSNRIIVHSFRLGPDIGSDHFPLILDFSLS
jgi:endonuclease/exonuclease/phosphatase (EEP) superfamily protein YafD